MNSLISAYRGTPAGKNDKRSDDELTDYFGKRAEAGGLTKVFDQYPDFASQYRQRQAPAARATVAPISAEAAADWATLRARMKRPQSSGGVRQLVGDPASSVASGLAKVGESVDDIVTLTTGFDIRPVQAVADTLGAGAAMAVEALSGRGRTGAQAAGEVITREVRPDEQGSEFFRRQKSPELQRRLAERAQAIADTDSELGQAWVAVKEMATSPRLIMDFIFEQLPMLLPGLGAGRAVRVAGGGLEAATLSAVGVGAVMEGADVGGETLDEVTQLLRELPDEEVVQIPEVAQLIAEGSTVDEARAAVALSAARKAGLAGAIASAAVNSLPGGRAIERTLARLGGGGGVKAKAADVARAMIGEGATEAIEGSFGVGARNYQAQPIDGRSLFEGTGAAGGMGFVGGAAMGGGVRTAESLLAGQEQERGTPTNERALAARRAAVTGDLPAPVVSRPAAELTPAARASVLVQQNRGAAAERLRVLSGLTTITPEEIAERDVLSRLLRSSQVPPAGTAAAPTLNSEVQKTEDAGSTPAPATTPESSLSKSPEALKESGQNLQKPLVAPPTTGELRLRVQRANAAIERVTKALPGIALPEPLAEAQKEILGGTFADDVVTRLEAGVAALEADSVRVTQARALERQQEQNARAKAAEEKRRAVQEKKNAKAVEQLARQIERERRAAFKADPAVAVAELTAMREAALASGQDVAAIDAELAKFQAKLPKTPAPADAVAAAVSAQITAADAARAAGAPSPALPAPFEFGEIENPQVINLEAIGNALSTRLAESGGRVSAEEAAILANRLEDGVRDVVSKIPNYSKQGNNSRTRLAVAWRMPSGEVVLAGLIPNLKKQALRVLGTSGKTATGMRVARMGSGGRSVDKVFKVGGSEPILFREMIEQGAVPLNIVQFSGEPGTPFQQFPDAENYRASLALTPVKAASASTEGGANQFKAGGAALVSSEDGPANVDAAQAAEANAAAEGQRTAARAEAIREAAAEAWRESRDQALNLHGQLVKAEGKMATARENLGKSRAKLAKTLLEWVDEVTDGVEGADLAIERMFTAAAGNAETFADLGGEAANWVASIADNTNVVPEPAAPAAKPVAVADNRVPEALAVAAAAYDLTAKTGKTPKTPDEVRAALSTAEAAVGAIERIRALNPKAKIPTSKGDVGVATALNKIQATAEKLRARVEQLAVEQAQAEAPALAAPENPDQAATLALWETIIAGYDGDVTRAAKAIFGKARTVAVEGRKVKTADLRAWLEGRALTDADLRGVYDVVENYEEFDRLMRGDVAAREDALEQLAELNDPDYFQFPKDLPASRDLQEVAERMPGGLRAVRTGPDTYTVQAKRDYAPGETVSVVVDLGNGLQAVPVQVVGAQGEGLEVLHLSARPELRGRREVVALGRVADPAGIVVSRQGTSFPRTGDRYQVNSSLEGAARQVVERGFKRRASAIYQTLYRWAANNGFVIAEDRMGTSFAGNYRRNAHQLSSAIREGRADHFEPTTPGAMRGDAEAAGANQLERMGLKSLGEWRALSYRERVAALARAEMSYVRELAPWLDRYGYNWATDELYEIRGRDDEGGAGRLLRGEEGRGRVAEGGRRAIGRDEFGEIVDRLDSDTRRARGAYRDVKVGAASARRYLAARSLLGPEGNQSGRVEGQSRLGGAFADSLRGILYRVELGENPARTAEPLGVRATQAAAIQRVAEGLRHRGIRMEALARIPGRPNARGASLGPHTIILAADDVANGTMRGLVTVIHEGGHSLFAQLADSTAAALTRAATRAMDKLRARAAKAAAQTGVRVAGNFNLNAEEALMETTGQEIAAEGIPEGASAARALWRAVKDIYLRTARALLEGVGAPQGVVDTLLLGWWDNHIRRVTGGDFQWAFINILDRFLPASTADRVAAAVNPDDATPGNIPEFVDPFTGLTINPSDVRFRDDAPAGLDLDRQTAWDRIEGASLNEVIPMLEEAKKTAAPAMDVEKFWKLIGRGENPTEMQRRIETRTAGSSSAQLNGEGMTSAMNQRAAERGLRRVKLLRNLLDTRIAGRTERINRASDQLLAQSERTAKIEAEYRDAGVLESSLREKLRDMTRQMLRATDQGMKLSGEAGRLGEAIANAEGLLEGEAIPEAYQTVLKAVMDGTVPVFDYLSALAKLGLDLPRMTMKQAQAAIRAAAPTDARIAALVANRPLFTTLTALAQNSAREMGLLQLRQMTNATEAAAIKAELAEIRTASRERLEKMWTDAQALADQTSLAARLRVEYLKERRTLRRLERTIADSAKDLAVMEGVREHVGRKLTDLEKAVGNFSAWYPVKDATWLAMRQDETGRWVAAERKLAYDEQDRVADVARVRDDLAANRRFLEANSELAGTETYERVKRQTLEISRLNLERNGLAAHRWWLLDALLPDVGTKFAQTGTAGGDLLRQQMRRFGEIVKFNQVKLDPLSHRWSAALKALFAEAGPGFDNYNDFFKRVVVPTIYKVESETGREEAAALREAREYARARVSAPGAKFDARLDEFLRRTKETADAMLEVAEANGVYVADPRLGGQLRRAISYGWLTAPRSLDRGVVRALMDDMAKAGWSVAWAETETKDSSGQAKKTRRVLNGNTFAGLDLEAADLGQQLASRFTPEVIDRWLEPFIRKPGKPIFYTPDGAGIDSLVVEQAWVDAGGDVLAWIDRLGEVAGVADANTTTAQWRGQMLGRLDALWAMEMKLAHDSSVVARPFETSAPKAHTLMDARLNDDIPPEHLTYAYFDPVQTANRLAEVAFHAAFGRNGDSANAALLSLQAELDNRAILRDAIWKEHGTKTARAAAAKEAGYDYNTLARAPKDKRRAREWEKAFRSLFAAGGRAGVVDDISAGQEMLRLQQILILNQPTSGLWNLLSATDFPIVFRGAGRTARAATARAVRGIFTEVFGSLFQDLGFNIRRGSAYAAEIGQMIDQRRLNSLEWGVRTADVGNRGQYGDARLSDGFVDWVSARTKQASRKAITALDKGLTPGDLLRGGRAAEGEFGRFNLLTSPFKFLNDTVAKATATSNVQTFESMVRRGLDFMADNPAAIEDPAFRFTAEDLGMEGDGLFGDRGAFDFYRTKAAEYGLGTLEDMVRGAAARKEAGQPLLTREQAMGLAVMALNEIALESSINNRPAEMFTNPVVRLATPLLGWPISKMNQVNQSLKTAEGQFAWNAAMRGLAVMALIAVPIGVAFSLGMDEWDERVRGKKSNLPEIGMDQTTRQNAVGIFARVARAGNVYGLGADLVYSMAVAPLDPASNQRQFTLDSRILAYSQMKTLFDALKAVPMQDWQMTWASGGRQLMLAMGGNGPIQYVQMLNQMGFNVSDAEARVIARQNVYASIRQAAVNSGVSVKRGGGSVTPNETNVWLREMQMAAMAGERLAFRDAYLKAVAAERAAGEPDPEAKVRDGWRRRNPWRVLENPRPSPLEQRKIFDGMDDRGRQLVREAIRNFETFSALIEPTPMEKQIARMRRQLDPAARMEARRRALAF